MKTVMMISLVLYVLEFFLMPNNWHKLLASAILPNNLNISSLYPNTLLRPLALLLTIPNNFNEILNGVLYCLIKFNKGYVLFNKLPNGLFYIDGILAR